MQTPIADTNQYRKLTLDNGIKVMLVSSQNAEKAAAAVSVQVGSYHDPKDTAGLAHFLEHMLFMGTKNYPDEDAYEKFLSEHNGNYNAYTADTRTVYYFDIQWDALQEIIPLFSEFFTSPLMKESAVSREKNAVNSEHEKNLQNDGWRVRHLLEHLANPKHPINKFGTGNLDTLDKPDIRDRLVKFYNTYYSSDKMCLSIVGRESLEELEMLARKYFSNVPQKENIPELKPTVKPYLNTNKCYLIKTIQDMCQITMYWFLSNYEDDYRCNPSHYASTILGYEGKDSLLSCLKPYGCISLVASPYVENTNFSTFLIQIEVNKERSDKKNLEQIINLCLGYVKMFAKEDSHENRYKLYSRLDRRHFNYSSLQKSMSLAQTLAISLEIYEDEYLLGSTMRHYDRNIIRKYLDELSNNSPVIFIQKQVGFSEESGTLQIEPIYSTEYKELPYTFKDIGSYNFALPSNSNPFEPKNMDLQREEPFKIMSSPVDVWFCQSSIFKVPKSCITISLFNTEFNSSVEMQIQIKLYIQMFLDHLNEMLYDAGSAGLHANIKTSSYRIDFIFKGFSDGILELIQRILQNMNHFELNQEAFEREKSKIAADYDSQMKEQPYIQLLYDMKYLQCPHLYKTEELLAANQKCIFKDIVAFKNRFNKLIQKSQARILVTGNESIDTVFRYANTVVEELKLKEVSHKKVPQLDVFPINKNTTKKLSNPMETNIAYSLHYHIGNLKENLQNYCCTLLVIEALSQPFFDSIRTKQQLGYIVACRLVRERDIYGIGFLGQAIKKEFPDKLIYKMFKLFAEETAVRIIQDFQKQESTTFEIIKKGLLNKLKEKPKSLYETHSIASAEIKTEPEEPDFNRWKKLSKIIKTITADVLEDFYMVKVLKQTGYINKAETSS